MKKSNNNTETVVFYLHVKLNEIIKLKTLEYWQNVNKTYKQNVKLI